MQDLPKVNHVMVDLETMGTAAGSPIISLGAAVFTANSLVDTFYIDISLQSNFDLGRYPDAATVLWWMQQSDSARDSISKAKDAVTLAEGMEAFKVFCAQHDVKYMWGNGATFDNTIIASSCRDAKVDYPISFRGDMCFRTVKNSYPHLDIEFQGTAHNAVDDAVHQVMYLMELNAQYGALKYL